MTLDRISGINAGYVLELYEKFRQDPQSVDAASRGYEANLRAFNTLRSMLVSALNIGKDQA